MSEETKKPEPKRTVTFNHRKKELTTTVSIDEMQAPNGKASKDFGSNKNVQVLKEAGIKILVKDLNAQKINYQRQHKEMEQQLEGLKNIVVDEIFLQKLRDVKEMDKKNQLEDAKKNAEETIETINKQLREVKGAVKEHIKF